MNKVLFCGAGYGAGNIGDDAILEGLLVSARAYLRRDTQYGALTYNPTFTKVNTEIDQVFDFVTGNDAAFNWATHIVFGGGSLLSGWSIEYCSELMSKIHAIKKPVCMLAAGTSITPTDHQKRLLKIHFNNLDIITLRSKDDRDLAIDWGLYPNKLWVCADGAFSIDHNSITYKPENLLGINLVSETLVDKHSYLNTMAQFLTDNVLYMNFSFICGEMRRESNFDYIILSKLFDQFGGELFCEYTHYLDFLRQLARCQIVITMRMHIMIFCALIGVPCIPLIREPKMKLMADSLDLAFTLSLDESLESLTNTIDFVLNEPSIAIADIDKVRDLKDRAMQNGWLLCQWMRKAFK